MKPEQIVADQIITKRMSGPGTNDPESCGSETKSPGAVCCVLNSPADKLNTDSNFKLFRNAAPDLMVVGKIVADKIWFLNESQVK